MSTNTASPKKPAPPKITIKGESKIPRPKKPLTRLMLDSPEAGRVCVAGTFNDWKPQSLESNNDGVWSIALNLTPGTYEYLFVVDDHWLPDPACIEARANPHGGENSVLHV